MADGAGIIAGEAEAEVEAEAEAGADESFVAVEL